VSVVLGLVTLEEALSRGESAGVITSPQSVSAKTAGDGKRWRAVAVALVALSAVAGLVGFRIAGPGAAASKPAVTRPVPPADVELVRDGDGALVQIVATDPQDVLIAYCALGPAPCEPQELFYGSPPDPGQRLGVLRQAGGPRAAIEIRRRGGIYDWAAGDGIAPIPLRTVPADAGVALPVGRRPGR